MGLRTVRRTRRGQPDDLRSSDQIAAITGYIIRYMLIAGAAMIVIGLAMIVTGGPSGAGWALVALSLVMLTAVLLETRHRSR